MGKLIETCKNLNSIAVDSGKNIIEDLRNNLPIISSVIIVLSLFRLILFYHYFGIDIVSYIEFNEALALSAPLFIFSALFITSSVLFMILMKLQNSSMRYVDYPKHEEGISFLKRFKHYTSPFGYYMFIVIFPLLVIVVILLSIRNNVTYMLEYTLTGFVYLIAWQYSEFWSSELVLRLSNANIFIDKNKSKIVILILGIFILFISYARYSALNVVYGDYKNLQQVYFVSNEDTVSTGRLVRYIGKTKNYIFVYNVKSGYADVYNVENIKIISLKDNDPHINSK